VSSAKGTVQKAAVRVIASELDRRSGAVERAVADLAAHQHAVAAEQDGRLAELRRQMAAVQEQLADVQQTQARLGRMIEELAARVRARELDAGQLDAAVRGLQDELLGVQHEVARFTTR
jgi:chromosome segregation ATPase